MYIPRLMCTQHPDSTIKVSTAEKVEEAAVAYLAYGCDEVMVDYEGKATPYSQPRDIAAKAISLGIPLGERYFITPRIPNPRLEDFERSMLALEASVIANSYSRKVADVDAVRWIILPMVEDFETLTLVYKALDLKTRDHLTKKIDEALDIMGIKPEPDETYTALLNNAETQAHALALG